MKRVLFALVALSVMAFASGCDDDYYRAPQDTRKSFRDQYPKARDVEWERHHKYDSVEFKLPGVSNDCEAWYTLDGRWILTEFDIYYTDLPQAVRTSFETEYGVATPVDDVKRLDRPNADTTYIIDAAAMVDGYMAELLLEYASDGTKLRSAVNVDTDYFYYDYLIY